MECIQFTAIVLMTLLTLKLLLLPGRVAVNPIVNKARWLMVGSTVLLGVQFLLQLTLGLRSLGVTQAVMLNLVFFIPCSWLMSLAILYLQRQGRVTMLDKFLGVIIWAVVLAILGTAAAIDGEPLLSGTKEIFHAEIIASCLFACMQGRYAYRHTTNLKAMSNALHNYFDRNQKKTVWSIYALALGMGAVGIGCCFFPENRTLTAFVITLCTFSFIINHLAYL